jgi:hypothetical protein
MLYTSFEETRIFPVLTQQYHDNTIERHLIQDGVNAPESIRTWKLSARVTSYADTGRPGALNLQSLRDFFNSHYGGLIPFTWYHPYETDDAPVGSNYDPAGDNEIGRHVVRFSSMTWTETTDMALTTVSFELQEIA